MISKNSKLRPGDLVEVKTPEEILQTLDADGALNHLPFMPEMIGFCGKRFRIVTRVVKTCCSTSLSSGMRTFSEDDVVLLEALRCSGVDHGGCQKSCAIFWRESWLRKVEEDEPTAPASLQGSNKLRARLKTVNGANRYFCQASEILKSTRDLSKWDRLTKCAGEVYAGNYSASQMLQRLLNWAFWRSRRILFGEFARGTSRATACGTLNLGSGELVQVKSLSSIKQTLNDKAHNRGLYFTPDMGLLCNSQQRVKKRVEKIIVDGTGEMRNLKDTVFLENSLCGCINALGGCPRNEYMYWREVWLQRVESKREDATGDPDRICDEQEVGEC